MMRAALWFVGLFALAVAGALFAGNNEGVVTLFWAPYRVDISLNLALLVLLGSFVLLYAALRGLAVLGNLPLQARRWRQQQKERAMYQALVESQSHLQAGRFVRARRTAQQMLKLSDELRHNPTDRLPHDDTLRAMAHMMAADSAHALQDTEARDLYYERALAALPETDNLLQAEVREGAGLRAARWALDDRDPQEALARLAALPHGAQRRTIALRIKLKAARLLPDTATALETTRLLAKHGGFSQAAATSLLRGLLIEYLHSAREPARLRALWDSLHPEETALPEVATAAARHYIELGGDSATARQWLLPVWKDFTSPAHTLDSAQSLQLVQTLQLCLEGIDDVWLGHIEAAYRYAPQNAYLQYLAGMACLQRQLWGKAEQLLQQASKRLVQPQLQATTWKALATLAEQREDTTAAHHAWRQAALLATP